MGGLRGGAGRSARAFLEEAGRAAGRSDAEALHDFRVALRRLLVTLKAAKGHCGIDQEARRRVRALLRSTNEARDAQVELDWLSREGRAALLRRARAELRPEAPLAVFRLFARLRERLEGSLRPSRWRRAATERAFATLARRAARLDRAPSPKDLHRARVAVKTLRYQLELRGSRTGLPAPPRLRSLQRALGAVHDRDVLLADLERWGRAEPALSAPAARAAARARRERAAQLARARGLWRRVRG